MHARYKFNGFEKNGHLESREGGWKTHGRGRHTTDPLERREGVVLIRGCFKHVFPWFLWGSPKKKTRIYTVRSLIVTYR